MTRPWLRPLSMFPLLAVLLGCATSAAMAPEPVTATSVVAAPVVDHCSQAQPWPAADLVFRRDPRWRGGDAAYSVLLGPGRTLWLFGDSFVTPADGAPRAGSAMVRNSVAIMEGDDPSTATVDFHYRHGQSGQPASFFVDPQGAWLWPTHGIFLDGVLTLFVYEVRHDPDVADAALAFKIVGSQALRVQDPSVSPDRWQLTGLPLPSFDQFPLLGVSVLAHGDHVYAYGVQTKDKHPLYLLRWTRQDFQAGKLEAPESWRGQDEGFGRGPPAPVLAEAATELSVFFDAPRARFVMVHSRGFGAAPISVRVAAAPEGPWGDSVDRFTPHVPPGSALFSYAGKAHPHLGGEQLWITYVTNSMVFGQLMENEDLYYPRFVRLPRDCPFQ